MCEPFESEVRKDKVKQFSFLHQLHNLSSCINWRWAVECKVLEVSTQTYRD